MVRACLFSFYCRKGRRWTCVVFCLLWANQSLSFKISRQFQCGCWNFTAITDLSSAPQHSLTLVASWKHVVKKCYDPLKIPWLVVRSSKYPTCVSPAVNLICINNRQNPFSPEPDRTWSQMSHEDKQLLNYRILWNLKNKCKTGRSVSTDPQREASDVIVISVNNWKVRGHFWVRPDIVWRHTRQRWFILAYL